MKDGTGAGEQSVLRQDVYGDYVKCYLEECAQVGPCRDPRLLKKAAQYLLNEEESTGTFTVFPFYQALTEGCEALSSDLTKHLSTFIKATEVLETLCINLFLQPWKKEIKTLKTFTGPFVYCLEPVFSNSTIQSVLASIGYVPHTDPKQCEYRLSEDVNADTAMLIGFELLLARVECYHFLELQEKDQLEPQEWLEVLRRRTPPVKLIEHTEKKTATVQTEDEEKKKTEELDKKEVPHLDTMLVVNPQPKSQHCNLFSIDHSIMEMQKSYPDLAIRGRPLLPDKPHKAHSSTSSSKAVCTTDLPKRDMIHTKAAAPSVLSRNDDSKAKERFDDNSRSSQCNDRNSGGTTTPGDVISCNFNSTDRSRLDDELSGPQAISLHITLRAGPKAEQSQRTGEPQPPADPVAWAQQKNEFSSLSSMDEEHELRELAERMGQLCTQENEHEATRKEDDNSNKKKKIVRKSSTEGETTNKQNLRKQVMEKGHDDTTCTRSSQCDPAVMNEQKQPTVCQPSLLANCTADCQDCKGDGSVGQQEGEGPGSEGMGPGEEEQMAHSFVIVEQYRH